MTWVVNKSYGKETLVYLRYCPCICLKEKATEILGHFQKWFMMAAHCISSETATSLVMVTGICLYQLKD
jgi:hypothetical protein